MFSIFKTNQENFWMSIPEAEKVLEFRLNKDTISKLKENSGFDLELASSYIKKDSEIMEVLNTVSRELGFDKEDYFQKFLELLVIEDPEASILLLNFVKETDEETFMKSLKEYFGQFNTPGLNNLIAPDIISASIAYYAFAILKMEGVALTFKTILLALNITNQSVMPDNFNPDLEYSEGTKIKGKPF